MPQRIALACLVGWIGATIHPSSSAAQEQPMPDRKLIVATKEAPPFSIRQPDGTWEGMSIELWKHIAIELKLEYELVERDLDTIVADLETGQVDAGVAALTITSERENRVDFSHSYYSSGLGIAVLPTRRSGWMRVLELFWSLEFLEVLAGLLVVLFMAGFLVWMFEKRKNRQQFESNARGLANGIWWSAVTMTTVGYGDKVPKTLGGRIVAVIWMFAGIMIISSFTAAIASMLTVAQLGSRVRGPDDLARVRIATVEGSTSEAYLRRRGFSHRSYGTPQEALVLLQDRKTDAVVYDAPILRYLAIHDAEERVIVLPVTFEPQQYGIALPVGSPLRESLNRSLLNYTAQPQWSETIQRYLGQ